MKTNSWTQKQRKILKNNTVCSQCWTPRYRVSVLSTKFRGCHPKGLIFGSLYKIKITMIKTMRLFTRKFSLLIDKKQKSTETHKKP